MSEPKELQELPRDEAAIRILSQQGYVPSTCTLPAPVAFPLIMSEVGAGRSPCWGCNHDRAVCHGEPKRRKTDE
jgi:hypothetical protein